MGLIAYIVLVAVAGAPQVAQQPSAVVRLFVSAPGSASGLSDPDLDDSVKDLKHALEDKHKVLVLVDSKDQADATIEVVSRGEENTGATATQKLFQGVNAPTREKVLHATLKAGTDFSMDMVGVNDGRAAGWRHAAGQIADKIEKWVKANGAKLIATRAGGGVPAPLR